MWDHPEAQCRIIFGHTGRTLSKSLHEYLDKNNAAAQNVPTTGPDDAAHGSIDLTLILDALGNRDSLGLRRFSRYLESIDVFDDDGHGNFYVKYKHRRSHMRV
jgi:hypothetical protein